MVSEKPKRSSRKLDPQFQKWPGRFVIISGPSGSGKTTLHKKLLLSPKIKGKLVKSISATTRDRRVGERNGRDYLFLSQAVFEDRIKRGYFIEWEKVFDHYYGTPKRQAINLLKKGIHVLLCIDVKGARHMVEQCPDALTIFIKTPSIKVLTHRLKLRASESEESLALRLAVAKEELKQAKHYQYAIVNGHLERAFRELERIVVEELLLEDKAA